MDNSTLEDYSQEMEEQISKLLDIIEALEKKHRQEKAELVKEISKLENKLYNYERERDIH